MRHYRSAVLLFLAAVSLGASEPILGPELALSDYRRGPRYGSKWTAGVGAGRDGFFAVWNEWSFKDVVILVGARLSRDGEPVGETFVIAWRTTDGGYAIRVPGRGNLPISAVKVVDGA